MLASKLAAAHGRVLSQSHNAVTFHMACWQGMGNLVVANC
jgi:hypothetical protein